jgi:drug/metabolite transporter (DMT)-like permease
MLPNEGYELDSMLMLWRRNMCVVPAAGVLQCLASAACFGALGIFGKLSYQQGATVGTLLVARFAVASIVLWAIVAATGGLDRVRGLTRTDLILALGLGAVGYSAQAGAYFGALQRIDPGLLGFLLYTYPAIVTVAAIRIGRAQPSRRTATALALTSAGLVLVLVAAGAGTLDPIGTLLGLTAAAVYSTYILTSQGITARIGPVVLSTLICTGATVTLTTGSLVAGDLKPGAVTPAGFVWLVAIAVISTVAAVALFFAGLDRVGPTAASILSTFEPLVTVVLASLAFGDMLTPLQLFGGFLILGGVVTLNVRRRQPAVTEPALGSG